MNDILDYFDLSTGRTFRANNIISILGLVFYWFVFLYIMFLFLSKPVSGVFSLIIVVFGAAYTIWQRRLKLFVDYDGVSYFNGFFSKKLIWNNIDSISIKYDIAMRSGLKFIIYSINDEKEDIRFSLFFFRFEDLKRVVGVIREKIPDVVLDKKVSKYLKIE